MPTKKPSRPLYEVFLERVIRIEAVQCYRAAVTDDHTVRFFAEGRRPGVFGDFLWSLDAPEAFPWGPLAPATSEKPAPVSLPMQHAWDAAVAAFAEFIAAFVNSELIATGVHPATGIRSEIESAEWARTGLVLDVRNGDLIEGLYSRPYGKHTVRWSTIMVRAAIQEAGNNRLGRGVERGRGSPGKGSAPERERLPARVRNADSGPLRRVQRGWGRSAAVQSRFVSWRRRAAAQEVSPLRLVGMSPQNPTKRHKTAWGGMGIVGHAKTLAARPSHRGAVHPEARAADDGAALHGDRRSAGG